MCRSVKSVFEPSGICVRPAIVPGFFSMVSRCISNLSFGGMIVNHRVTPSISCTTRDFKICYGKVLLWLLWPWGTRLTNGVFTVLLRLLWPWGIRLTMVFYPLNSNETGETADLYIVKRTWHQALSCSRKHWLQRKSHTGTRIMSSPEVISIVCRCTTA